MTSPMPDAFPSQVGSPQQDPCARCDYDLRGIADDQPCPECGLLAERSRQRSWQLAEATPRWLRALTIGTAMVLLAHLLALVWLPLSEALRRLVQTPYRVLQVGNRVRVVAGPNRFAFIADRLELFYLFGFDLAALLLFGGVWLISRPQRGAVEAPRDRRLRRLLRASALMPMVALLVAHGLLFHQGFLGRYRMEPPQLAILLLLTFGSAPMPVLLFMLLRRLAQRVLNPRLAEHATIVAVGYAATLMMIPLLLLLSALGEAYGGTHWSGRSSAAMIIWLAMIVGVIFFGGWTLLNCGRFVRAFGNAHRIARRKWAEADRGGNA